MRTAAHAEEPQERTRTIDGGRSQAVHRGLSILEVRHLDALRGAHRMNVDPTQWST